MVKRPQSAKLKLRRAKKADLVVKKQRRTTTFSRAFSRWWHSGWDPVKTTLGKSVDVPAPKGKLGRKLNTRIRAPKYFREAWAEVKKVQWPTRREAWRLTFAVFLFALFFAIFTAVADYGFSKAVEKLLVK